MSLVPLVIGLVTSFTNYDGLASALHGWDGSIINGCLPRTMMPGGVSIERDVITIVGVPLGTIGGFGLATLLNQKVKSLGIFRTVFYLPSIIPIVVTALMFRFIYDRDGGPLNALISLFRPGTALAWLSDDLCRPALIGMLLWGLGGGMVIYLAGLQGIPVELKEVAAIDGAAAWQCSGTSRPAHDAGALLSIGHGHHPDPADVRRTASAHPGPSGGTFIGAMPPMNNRLFVNHAFIHIFSYQGSATARPCCGCCSWWSWSLPCWCSRASSYWVYYEVDQEGKRKMTKSASVNRRRRSGPESPSTPC